MKIRQGFVSNSSTSSFVAVGFYVDASEYTTESLTRKLDCSWKGLNKDVSVFDSEYYGKYEYDDEAPIPDDKFLVTIKGENLEGACNVVVPLAPLYQRLEKMRQILGLSEESCPLVLFHHMSGG